MIQAEELRLGNYILQKLNHKVVVVPCNFSHFELLKTSTKDFFPVLLKPEHFEKAGFLENKKYALLPDAREFILQLPVIGKNETELYAYSKNNKECFARATLNKLPVSNNIYNLHQLQNLYFVLTGKEIDIRL